MYEVFFPSEPNMTPPAIVIHSPVQNQGYDTTEVLLNFSIIKPETWFVYDVARQEDGGSMTLTVGKITSVYYVLDNGDPQNIPVNDKGPKNITNNDGDLASEFSIAVFPDRILNFSTTLGLTGGAHSVGVGFEAESFYFPDWESGGLENPGFRSAAVNGFSDTIRFNVASSLPATIVIAPIASVAVVGVGLLFYFKKHKRRTLGA
jgi:hypothetical protein